MRRIYLDHASTTRLADEVRLAMLPFLSGSFGSSAGLHARGEMARQAIALARAGVGDLLGAPADEIVFTGSATEANNLAIKGIALTAGARRGHFIAAATEHVSVLHPLRSLQRLGFRVSLIQVDRHGLVDPDDLLRALTPDTLLISVSHATGEIGTLQPLPVICRLAHQRGILVHSDATLTAGLLPIPQGDDGPDLLALTPHLFYGPAGVGALRLRQGVRLTPLIEGGVQEGGLRAGTEPLAAIVGFGAAARLSIGRRERRAGRAAGLAARLRSFLLDRLEGLVPTGHPTGRVPGHLSLCVRGVEAEALLRALDAEGVEAASGSACTTEARKASHVLEAIGLDPVLARGAIVLSFGEATRDDDPESAGPVLVAAIDRLRAMSPVS